MSLLVSQNGETLQMDVKGQDSPFRAPDLDGPGLTCLFWGRDRVAEDGAGRVLYWPNLVSPAGEVLAGPATDSQKPTRILNEYRDFPALGCTKANLQNVYNGPLGAAFSGDDTPFTVVTVLDVTNIAPNSMAYAFTNTTLANPACVCFISTQWLFFRRDDTGAIVSTNSTINATLGRHLIIDSFRKEPFSGIGRRTVRIDGAPTSLTDISQNVGVSTFDRFASGVFYNGSTVPTLGIGANYLEQALYSGYFTPGQFSIYEEYAKARYGIP